MMKPLNILLVEDDADSQNIFQMLLTRTPHALEVVANGEDALSYLNQHAPDVAIIDIVLPDFDGYQLLDQIRQAGCAPTTRFVAITAYHSVGTRDVLLRRGFNEFMPKPLDSASIVDLLERVAS